MHFLIFCPGATVVIAMTWSDSIKEIIIDIVVFCTFFIITVPLAVIMFSRMVDGVGRWFKKHHDASVRILASLTSAFIMALFWVTYGPTRNKLESIARYYGWLPSYELAIFTPNGAETPQSKVLEKFAVDAGFPRESVYVTMGKTDDYRNETRIVWFNSIGLQAAKTLLNRSGDAGIPLCKDSGDPDSQSNANVGYVEFWYPDPKRSVAVDQSNCTLEK